MNELVTNKNEQIMLALRSKTTSFLINHRVHGEHRDNSLSLRPFSVVLRRMKGILQSVLSKQSHFPLVTKLHFVTKLKAKFNFAEKCVPKCNLGTRNEQSRLIILQKI